MKIRNLKFLLDLNLFSMIRLRFGKIVEGKLILFRKTSIQYFSSSNITIKNGVFQVNKKWTQNDPFCTLLYLGSHAKIIVNNTFSIYTGSRIYINDNATLILGGGYINNNLNLSCFEKIEIGTNVAISENVCIRDSDNHEVIPGSQEPTKPIKIGNHVWIGMNTTILKGVTIHDGSIIAAGSVVNQDIPEKCLAGGVPAKVLKTNVVWK